MIEVLAALMKGYVDLIDLYPYLGCFIMTVLWVGFIIVGMRVQNRFVWACAVLLFCLSSPLWLWSLTAVVAH